MCTASVAVIMRDIIIKTAMRKITEDRRSLEADEIVWITLTLCPYSIDSVMGEGEGEGGRIYLLTITVTLLT